MAVKKGSSLLSPADKKTLRAMGAKIKKLREKADLSVFDLTGDDMPIKSRQHWQLIENGQKNINITTLFKIAKTLCVKPEDLIGGL